MSLHDTNWAKRMVEDFHIPMNCHGDTPAEYLRNEKRSRSANARSANDFLSSTKAHLERRGNRIIVVKPEGKS